jgi:hypothetical protein
MTHTELISVAQVGQIVAIRMVAKLIVLNDFQ